MLFSKVEIWQEETVEIIRAVEAKLESVVVIEQREEVMKIIEEIEERLHEQERKIEEAEQILKKTEGNSSCNK